MNTDQKNLNTPPIPEWQKEIVRKRREKALLHPESLIGWKEIMEELDKEND